MLIAVLPFWLLFYTANIIVFPGMEKLIFLSVVVTAVGIVDDIAGKSNYKGFRGHFQQLFSGQLTTGLLKVFVTGAAVFLIVSAEYNIFREGIVVFNRGQLQLIADFFVLLLWINFFNLLDLRPGRVIKLFYLVLLLLYFLFPVYSQFWQVLLPLIIILIPYLLLELKEVVMLGDSGAAFLGAVSGYALLSWNSLPGKLLLLLGLLVLTLLAEKYSFSKIIAGNNILNWLDMLGRIK